MMDGLALSNQADPSPGRSGLSPARNGQPLRPAALRVDKLGPISSDEPFEDFRRLATGSRVPNAPSGGWLSLWQPRHTMAAAALLPVLLAINLFLSGFLLDLMVIIVATLISAAQAVVIASYLPQQSKPLISTCVLIPPAVLFAASALLTEISTGLVFGLLALALASTGVAFRFFATTCQS